MKIAITSAVYYPMTNGIATFSHNLAIGLANKGHEVMVICPSFSGKSHQVKRDGVTTVYLKSNRIPFYPDQINKVPDKKEILGKDRGVARQKPGRTDRRLHIQDQEDEQCGGFVRS